MELGEVLRHLRLRKESVPHPLPLPTADEVNAAERALGVSFRADYRRYLLEASDVVAGGLEPCVVVPNAGHLDLVETVERAWAYGVPRDLLPICEDNGDYYCLERSGAVRFWSHNGTTDESWPDLATWIATVWIGERIDGPAGRSN